MADIYDAYEQLRGFESDFDKAQGPVRQAASVWIVAATGAIAFLLISQYDGGTSSRAAAPIGILGALVSSLSVMGLYLLWYVDQNIYQRLLHSVFVYGLALERAHPELPQVRTALFTTNQSITGKLGQFYKIPIWVFTALFILFTTCAIIGGETLKIGKLTAPDCVLYIIFGVLLFLIAWAIMRIRRGDRRETRIIKHYSGRFEPGMLPSDAEMRALKVRLPQVEK